MEFEYDISLSFHHKDKEIANRLTEALESDLVKLKVFNYLKDPAGQAGRPLMSRSQEIYQKKSRHVVILASKNYDTKGWASTEWRFIKEEDRKRPYRYLLSLRLDDTIINGLDNDTVYQTWEGHAMELAALYKKVIEDDYAQSSAYEKESSRGPLITNPDPKPKRSLLFYSAVVLVIVATIWIWLGMREEYYIDTKPLFIHQRNQDSLPKPQRYEFRVDRSNLHICTKLFVNSKFKSQFKEAGVTLSVLHGDTIACGIKTPDHFITIIDSTQTKSGNNEAYMD